MVTLAQAETANSVLPTAETAGVVLLLSLLYVVGWWASLYR
jgi:hypothetical protein